MTNINDFSVLVAIAKVELLHRVEFLLHIHPYHQLEGHQPIAWVDILGVVGAEIKSPDLQHQPQFLHPQLLPRPRQDIIDPVVFQILPVYHLLSLNWGFWVVVVVVDHLP